MTRHPSAQAACRKTGHAEYHVTALEDTCAASVLMAWTAGSQMLLLFAPTLSTTQRSWVLCKNAANLCGGGVW